MSMTVVNKRAKLTAVTKCSEDTLGSVCIAVSTYAGDRKLHDESDVLLVGIY